jgi:DNA modification methylase
MSDRYTIHNQDCIAGMAEHLEPGSIDLTVTSIPFADLFMYSGKTEDVGNSLAGTDIEGSLFGLHLRFFIDQLVRVMAPGSLACIHIQQLRADLNEHGYMGRRDFRGSTINAFMAGGLTFTGEFVICKNPQAMAQKSKMHSLLFETGKTRDARKLAPAMNDMVLIFRKDGAGRPVRAIYDPDKNPRGWITTEEWIRDAHGIWTDIRETDVLAGHREAREEGDERHVCPLQLEVIRRCVRLWSNPDDLVLDPFMGIGSTAVIALEQGRRAIGFELKESYHRQALANCELELRRQVQANTLPLFEAAGLVVT